MAYVEISAVGDRYPTTRHVGWIIMFVMARHADYEAPSQPHRLIPAGTTRKHLMMVEWETPTAV